MILVTGGTGFIGEHLVRSLAAQGRPLRILVRSKEKAAALYGPLLAHVEVAVGDLAEARSLRRALEGVEQVYHLASWISFQAPMAQMRQVNVEGTRSLMEAARAAGVKRVLHMSSVAAGGPAVAGADGHYWPRVEEEEPAPLPDAYSQTKLEQERLVLEYQAEGIEVVVVRPSAVFGPGDPTGVNTLLRLVKERKLPFYLGSAQGAVNLVFVRDVVRGTILAMNRGRSGEIYNLVGANLSQEQLFGLLAQVSGGKAPSWALPVGLLLGAAGMATFFARVAMRPRSPLHPHDVRSWTAPWVISDEKSRKELGLVATDLAAALRETLIWMQEQKAARSAVAASHVE